MMQKAPAITGKERDVETGLDFFEARYYSGAQGRFTSPDEFKGGGLFDPATGRSVETIGPLPYADIGDPQTLNKYAYVRNSPLRYVDPDGHDVDLADPKLEDQFMRIAADSPALMDEYKSADDDDKMNVQVVERGLRRNEQGSQADVSVAQTDENGVTKVVIYVDPYRTTDDQIEHEWGHESDARQMGGTKFVNQAGKEKKQYPDKADHNKRPLEQSADRFKDKVNKEKKEHQKQRKQERKAEKQRKKQAGRDGQVTE